MDSPDPSGLSAQERARAWRQLYLISVEQLPDRDRAWEAAMWRRLDTPGLAQLCDRVSRELREADLVIEGGASSADLDVLWQHIDQAAALQLVHSEGLSLVTAARTVYWTRARNAA